MLVKQDPAPSKKPINSHDLISKLSHELRSPLNPIMGFSQILLDGLDGDLSDDAQQDIRAIYSGAQTLLMLLDSLIDWARLESDRLMAHPETHDLTEIIQGFVRQEMTTQTSRISIILPEDTYSPVFVDKGRIRQVLRYALQPALNHTKEERIDIRCTQSAPGTLLVEISGFAESAGFADESVLMKRLMVLEERSLSEETLHGETLALHVAQRLIEVHNGEMGLRIYEGIPETIWFTLPAQTE
jgi:signal transduction histidine kinase